MSSGLYVKKSSITPSWEYKRLWINLASLGIHSIHFGGGDVSTSSGVVNGNDNSCHTDSYNADTNANAHSDADNNILDVRRDGNAAKTTKKERREGRRMRSLWLQHIMLESDMVTEPEGIEVRNIEGLSGVDYLSPGALTNLVSYVFGPVIDALRKVGYDNGEETQGRVYNLDAAPYDWRLPPHMLEKRDKYVTKTMAKIEKLYTSNGNTPVVMVCHSLGCKTGHYFLNYVEEQHGQSWIDKYIHTFLPVGAPHLGAPSAIRSLVAGEKMGLDTFLSDAESLAFGRTIGSGPFLLPSRLPTLAPANVHLRREGAIEVWLSSKIDVQPLFELRQEGHTPNKLILTVVYNKKYSGSSAWTPIEVDAAAQTVTFDEKFWFKVPADGPPKNTRLTFMLCEPGLKSARARENGMTRAHRTARRNFFSVWKYNNCTWYPTARHMVMHFPGSAFMRMACFCPIICPILKWFCFPIIWLFFQLYFGVLYALTWCLFRGTLLAADELSKASGTTSVTAHLTVRNNEYYELTDATAGMTREVHTNLVVPGVCGTRKKVPISFKIRFISPDEVAENTVCSPIGQPHEDGGRPIALAKPKAPEVKYEARSSFDMLSREGVGTTFAAIQKQYDADPLDPRGRTSFDRPPVSRIKAVYGINLPTEVGAVYRRHKVVVDRKDTVLNFHRLDTDARVVDEESGYITKGGKLLETKETVQPDGTKASGDGTVPYWSMQHVKTWNSNVCHVTVDTLDGAPHREILADSRFHDLLTSYVCRVKEEV